MHILKTHLVFLGLLKISNHVDGAYVCVKNLCVCFSGFVDYCVIIWFLVKTLLGSFRP